MTLEPEADVPLLTPEERAETTRLCEVLAQGVAPDDALAVTMQRLLPKLLAQVERLEEENRRLRAEATRNVLRYTVKGFKAGEKHQRKQERPSEPLAKAEESR